MDLNGAQQTHVCCRRRRRRRRVSVKAIPKIKKKVEKSTYSRTAHILCQTAQMTCFYIVLTATRIPLPYGNFLSVYRLYCSAPAHNICCFNVK